MNGNMSAVLAIVTQQNAEFNGKAKRSHYRPGQAQRVLRKFPDFMTTAQDGGKVVSLTHRPRLPPGNTPGTYFC